MVNPRGKSVEQVTIEPILTETIEIPVIGTSPLITHAWSEKARKDMRDKQMGLPQAKKDPKDPFEDFMKALYPIDDSGKRFGIPVNAIKNAMVSAASFVKGLTKVQLRGALFVQAELTEDGDELIEIIGVPRMREDNVRLQTGVADLRHRPCFVHWAMKLSIEFDKSIFTREAVMNLLQRAGWSVGLCEWRPERNGNNGRFRVAVTADNKMIKTLEGNQKKMKPVYLTREDEAKRMGFALPTRDQVGKVQRAAEEKKKADAEAKRRMKAAEAKAKKGSRKTVGAK